MFVLGFHYPASMGNSIPFDAVEATLNTAFKEKGDKTQGVKSVTITKTNNDTVDFADVNSFLGKALVNYVLDAGDDGAPKYLVYTNRYQMSEISKTMDKSEEARELCRLFDGRDKLYVSLVR